jgi:hypothetical protein
MVLALITPFVFRNKSGNYQLTLKFHGMQGIKRLTR